MSIFEAFSKKQKNKLCCKKWWATWLKYLLMQKDIHNSQLESLKQYFTQNATIMHKTKFIIHASYSQFIASNLTGLNYTNYKTCTVLNISLY